MADSMSPDASPTELGKRSGVRRVNNLPLYIIGTAFTMFLVIMVVVAMNRANRKNGRAGEQKQSANTSMYAKEIVRDYNEGLIPAKKSGPPAIPDQPQAAPELTVPIARPNNPDSPPLPPRRGDLQRTPADNDLERIRQAKLQMFEQAVKGKTTVQVTDFRNKATTTGEPGTVRREEPVRDPTAAYKARLSQLQGTGTGAPGGAVPQLVETAADRVTRNDLNQFARHGQGDRWRLDSKPEVPRTPYELRAGFVVPAVMISGINSDLPGQIIAQVSQNVYDTPTGKYMLIPQGSRLVGSYSSDVAYGQARILVAWQRIVFPDGKAMDIGAMPGADGAGYAGFQDEVNNHYFRTFSSAFLMSGIIAGINLSQDSRNNDNGNTQRASDALSEAMGQQFGTVIAQMVSKNLNVAPTLTIRPGYRFNVMVVKDMTFTKPYQSFDYYSQHRRGGVR
jgi:type IV secretion system protein VirB10